MQRVGQPALVVERALPEHRVELRLAPGRGRVGERGREALALDRALRVALEHRRAARCRAARRASARRRPRGRTGGAPRRAPRSPSATRRCTCRRRRPRSRRSASSTGTACRTPTPSRCCSGCRSSGCRARRGARGSPRCVSGDVVEELVLVERAVRAALAAGAVVGDDHDDRVVELAGLLEVVDQPRRSGRRCRRRSPAYTSAMRANRRRSSSVSESHGRTKSSCGHGWPSGPVASGSPCGLIGDSSASSGSRPSFFWSREDRRADRLVALVEAALVLVRPLLEHVVRRVRAARAEVHEPRLVGRDRLGVADELDRLVGEVLREVVALLGRRRRRRSGGCRRRGRDTTGSSRRRGSRRSARSRGRAASGPSTPTGRTSSAGREVPLADRVGVPAALVQHLGDHAVLERDPRGEAREARPSPR